MTSKTSKTSKGSKTPPDQRENQARNEPQDNPGMETTVPTTEEGDTPMDERYRMTGQESGSDVRPGAEAESAGAAVTRPGLPNQGTESR
jgi:photosystem I subunit 4